MRKLIVFSVCIFVIALHGQTSSVSIQTVSNYNQWGWEAVVMQNDLITVATVPVIGARVMQYDLGDHASIFVNPSEKGKTYNPVQGFWPNFGGYKTWPAPQNKWNWPPPPNLDYGNYSFQITSQTDDSVAVFVSSPVEKWLAPNIRFERKAIIYSGSSLVRMEQTVINDGKTAVDWGVWDVTQSIVNHPGKKDYDNFWVYFPINPNSLYGESGVNPQSGSGAWKGEVAPGVYGIQFHPDGKKIFADPHKGWIAYADLLDGVVYAKTFEVFEGADYPDNGARVATYIDDTYMEVEVMSPIVELAANGGRYTFTENWWAAKVRSPVLEVDSVGTVGQHLSYDSSTQMISGIYGVFYKGTAKTVFINTYHEILAEGQPHAVSPLEEFQLQETAVIPDGAKTVEVQVQNDKGEWIGVLESADVSQLLSAVEVKSPAFASDYRLTPNYPNPFNGGTVLTFSCAKSAQGSLKIYDLRGKEVDMLESGRLDAGEHRCVWNPEKLASGLYIAKLEIGGVQQIQKMVYVR